jgi:nicotinate-nucleotide--dimethylbenzimidazole phosphoribosyltransferase
MAPNNGLANSKPIRSTNDSEEAKNKSGSTTILKAGTVESRGMGTNINSREVISKQIQTFLNGEGRLSPKAEIRGFFTVWTFVTRLPGPTWVDHHPGYLMRGMAYFPLSGSLIGLFVSVFFDFLGQVLTFPLIIASVGSELSSLWITGCFHEDGLADSADGIGGGWTRDQILKIMTDSRLGTYGCAVLVLYLLAKVELIATLGTSVWTWGECNGAGPAILVSHTLARLTSPLLIKTRDYVDEMGPKYRFYSFFVQAKHLVTWHRVAFAMSTSFALAYVTYGVTQAIVLLAAVIVSAHFSGRYAEYLLAGVMGDYLGATICVTEIFLLSILTLAPDISHISAFFEEWRILGMEIQDESLSWKRALELVIQDERKLALVRFFSVGLFTTLWCCNVGHPPVFVRKSVASKADSDQIPIALTTKDDDNTSTNEDDPNPALTQNIRDCGTFSKRYETARVYLDSLAKPVGSLGTLEDWGARLAALQKISQPKVDNVVCLIFAADHGVAKDISEGGQSCSAYPQAVTKKVLEGLDSGLAGASVLARQNNTLLRVIDIGLVDDVDWCGGIVSSSPYKISGGTNNFCKMSAMSGEEVEQCILAGRQEVKKCVQTNSGQIHVFAFGEVGIGNTTTSSALLAALTGKTADTLCGTGATITRSCDDSTIVAKKIAIIKESLSFHKDKHMCNNPLQALKNIGGAEIAAIVGGILEAAERDVAVLVDGFIVSTAAMIACQISPSTCRALLFATRSTEIGQSIAFETIQSIARDHGIPAPSKPALDMNLRMGEGSGALIAIPILKSSVAILSDLATLEKILSIESESGTC